MKKISIESIVIIVLFIAVIFQFYKDIKSKHNLIAIQNEIDTRSFKFCDALDFRYKIELSKINKETQITDINSNIFSFSDILYNESKLFFHFSDHDCSPCFEHAINTLKQYSNKILLQPILIANPEFARCNIS